MTTAHKWLPFGTMVKLMDVNTGKTVLVRVNDRGPTQQNRIVDVTRKAAEELMSLAKRSKNHGAPTRFEHEGQPKAISTRNESGL